MRKIQDVCMNYHRRNTDPQEPPPQTPHTPTSVLYNRHQTHMQMKSLFYISDRNSKKKIKIKNKIVISIFLLKLSRTRCQCCKLDKTPNTTKPTDK